MTYVNVKLQQRLHQDRYFNAYMQHITILIADKVHAKSILPLDWG